MKIYFLFIFVAFYAIVLHCSELDGGLTRLDRDGAVEIHFNDNKGKNDVKKIVIKCDNKDKEKKKCKESSESSCERRSKHYWSPNRGLGSGFSGYDYASLIHEYPICPDVYCSGNKVALNPPVCYCGCGNYHEMRACFDSAGHYTWDSVKCECVSSKHHNPMGSWLNDLWDKFYPRIVD